jgi:hypothetical protein
VLAAGLALLALSRSTVRDWAGLTDAAIIAIGFGLLSWVLVMVPYFQDPSLGLVQRLVSLAYPVGDVLLLALAARLATSPGRRTAAFRLLVASLIVTMAADTLFSVLSLSGASVAVTDGMYLVDYLLLGAAGLHPSMAGLLEPAPAAPGTPGPGPVAGHGGGRPGRPGPAGRRAAPGQRPPGHRHRRRLGGAVPAGDGPDGRARAWDRAG